MRKYLITYDLMRPGQAYGKLFEAIKSYGSWCHLMDSAWLIRTTSAAKEVRDHLIQFIDTNDKLFVGGWSGEAAWYGLDTVRSDWLAA